MRYTVSRCKSRRVGDSADYILPIGLLIGGGIVVYEILNKLGITGGSSVDPALLAKYSAAQGGTNTTGANVQSPGLAPTTNMASLALEASDAIASAVQGANQNTQTSPFLPYLYQQNPTEATIDETTATNLFQNVLDADGGLFSSGDFTGILADFQAVVGNQVDISFVSDICQQQKNTDLMSFIMQNNTFGNSGGQGDNVILVWTFVQWVLTLPPT